ncbi:hypothetical protein [Burkholderia thailandensis]|uniref:hypothetical protein n=1 Tax=Burkholderia thailandensis TaxID=57975 RepID=UPI001E5BE682|nr:hypothetical protein [Burkholderia thailandensis]
MIPTNQMLRIQDACALLKCQSVLKTEITLLTIVTSNASSSQPIPSAIVIAVWTRFH